MKHASKPLTPEQISRRIGQQENRRLQARIAELVDRLKVAENIGEAAAMDEPVPRDLWLEEVADLKEQLKDMTEDYNLLKESLPDVERMEIENYQLKQALEAAEKVCDFVGDISDRLSKRHRETYWEWKEFKKKPDA